jgi:putative ABC transport system permease protein
MAMISSADLKLGLRMLKKYPGLTVAGGLALAIAIGLGAGWYDFSQDLLHPRLPLPGRDRIVDIDMRDSMAFRGERRILHDFVAWRRDARSIELLSASRTVERSLTRDRVRVDSVLTAEITASAFRVARVPPLLGRTLLDADEQRDAPAVVVLGYQVWQRWFSGSAEAIGETVLVGTTSTTVVGVMPEGFTFPVNHQLWVPLQLRPTGYAPLEGVPISVFGLLAPGATHTQANAEFETLTRRTAAASPQTHAHLRPRVRAFGGVSPGSVTLELAVTHLPILLVLIVACVTVGILVYARTATRDAEIATRYALGGSRRRILSQLFAEALVLASVAGVVGLTAAHWALKWGKAAYYSGQTAGPPFWIGSGLKLTTVLYAAVLAVAGAALLGVLPALKATGSGAQSQLRNLGSGGSTLRFGRVWTAVMIGQVALTVIMVPPAMGIAEEGLRDRVIRSRFPVEEYLAVSLELDRETGGAEETDAAFASRRERTYAELERRIAQESSVAAVTFGDRLPGMEVGLRRAEVEVSTGAAPVPVENMWTAAVGPGYFEAFDRSIVVGRDFHSGDRVDTARTVIVNEAFARRRFMNGAHPIGRRVRYTASNGAPPGPWFEIVGVARDFGMTPTDFGEAPYVYHPASAGTVAPLVMGVRARGDRSTVAQRLRAIAAEVDPALRIDDLRMLDELAWNADIDGMAAGGSVAAIVLLGLFLSATAIYSLMSVTVARRTREIGLRSALGASPRRMLGSIFSKAAWIVGIGVVTGNLLLMTVVTFASGRIPVAFVVRALMITSGVMLTVGLLACVEPARRALRIHPTDALRHL